MVISKSKIGIILQARTGSTRLPGKVLKPLAGKPMIQWIIERLQKCQQTNTLILATTELEQDQPLVDLVDRLNVNLFRGSKTDVLDRYYHCAKVYYLDHIIRATGDNPFVDFEECDRLVNFYFTSKLDYATVVTHAENGFPLGVGVEIFNFASLQKAWQEGHAPHHREHVNEYILENPDLFRQSKMFAPLEKCAPELSLTVDTQEQFSHAEALYLAYFNQRNGYPFIPTAWIIKYLRGIKC